MADMEPKKLSREKLEDGSVLLLLKERFQDDMTEDNLLELMQVLRDSVVILPMQVLMSAADAERMRLYEENMKFVAENEVQVVPAVSELEGEKYMFIFSQAEQIPVEYSESVTLMRAPY
ncbi:MAG: SseB family protein, partial [Clostridia bacterium]|nr:SseB family protein [Clostridia bacterium]